MKKGRWAALGTVVPVLVAVGCSMGALVAAAWARGMPIREIFVIKGEAYFRSLEKQVLKEILERDRQVIATGGGAVLDDDNLRLLKKRSRLICLTAQVEKLLQRSGSGKERPLLKGDDKRQRIERLLRQREKSYDQAHFTIDTTRLSVDEVVEQILFNLRGTLS